MKMNVKKTIKVTAKWMATAIVSLVLCSALLFGLAQTGAGRHAMGRLIARTLSEEGKSRVEIGQITGVVPFHFEMDRFALSDDEGPWVVIEGVLLDWSPIKLLRGRVHIKEASASLLQLERLGKDRKRDESERMHLPRWTSALRRLKVERFAIDRVDLGEPLLGERASFKVEASVMAALPGREWVTSLRLERTDGPAARIVIKAVMKGHEPVLTLHAEAEVAQGGLAAKTLGMDGPLSLSFRGEGPVQDWKGQVQVHLAKFGSVHSEVYAELRDDLKLTLRGDLEAKAGQIPTPLGAWLGARTHFAIKTRIPKGGAFVVDSLSLESGDTALDLTGSMELKEKGSIKGQFNVACKDLAPFRELLQAHVAGKLRAEGSFSGTLPRPQGTVNLKLSDLEVERVRLQGMEGDVRIELSDGQGSGDPSLRLDGSGRVTGFAIRDLKSLHDRDFKWSIAAEGPIGKAINVRALTLAGDGVSLQVSGEVDPSGPRGAVQLGMEIRDLQPFSHAMGFEIHGATWFSASVEGDLQRRLLSARIHGKLGVPAERNPAIASAVGENMGYEGKLSLREGPTLVLSEAHVQAAAGTLTGGGSIDLTSENLNGAFRFESQNLGVFAPLAETSLGGSLQLNGAVEGTLKSVRLKAEANGQDVLMGSFRLGAVVANVQASGLPRKGDGHVVLELRQGRENIGGITDFSLDGDRLSLSGISLRGPGTKIEGRLSFDFTRNMAEGDLKGKCEDLSALSAFLGQKLAGRAEVQAEIGGSGNTQQLGLRLVGRDLTGPFGEASELLVQARMRELSGVPGGNAKLEVKGFRLQGLTIPSLLISAEGNAGEASFSTRAKGHYRKDFEIDTTGTFSSSDVGQSVRLNRLQARYAELPIRLTEPAVFQRSEDGISFDAVRFSLGQGTLTGAGRLASRSLDFTFGLEGLPVGALQLEQVLDLDGTLAGELRMEGTPEQPEGRVELRIDALRMHGPQFEAIPPAVLKTKADLQGGRLRAELALLGLTTDPLKTRLEIPLAFSLSPFSVELSPQGELQGSLNGDADLARIGTFLGLDDQSLGGFIGVALALEGTVENPRITGGVHVDKGVYENARTGTILKDIEVSVVAKTPRLIIEHARASDGEQGTISGKGWLDLNPTQGFPLDVSLALQQARLLRQDVATGTAGGELSLSGSLSRATISGGINIETAEVRIPEQLPVEIPELEVIEIHAGEKGVSQTWKEASAGQFIQMDLWVKSPGRVFVSGRGLDSEWKGELHLTGSTNEPVITGRLSVIRGRFSFLDRRFNLSQGVITFDGTVPPSPLLDVLAEAKSKDMTAKLLISGPVRSPDLKLSSDPTLPSDEILSRLLFGKSAARISPIQAIQLVHAVNQLRGGRGLDLMGQVLGQTRKLLGADQIDVKQSGAGMNEPAISAGKYLRDNVYFEVEQSLGPGGAKASVDWELTPNISVETEMGTRTVGGVGLNWKWDY